MAVKLELNISNKAVYTFIAVVLILAAGITVYAYTAGSIPNPGHGADSIWVSIYGNEKNLQDAIDELETKIELSGRNTPGIREIDLDSPIEYTVSTRYHITATAANYAGKTKPIDHDKLIELCGDFDGCEVRIGMTKWDLNTRTETASRGSLLFYYSPSDGHWRTSHADAWGVDGDGNRKHVINIWSACYFTDGEYESYHQEGDVEGFGLLVWNQYSGSERTCELTLID